MPYRAARLPAGLLQALRPLRMRYGELGHCGVLYLCHEPVRSRYEHPRLLGQRDIAQGHAGAVAVQPRGTYHDIGQAAPSAVDHAAQGGVEPFMAVVGAPPVADARAADRNGAVGAKRVMVAVPHRLKRIADGDQGAAAGPPPGGPEQSRRVLAVLGAGCPNRRAEPALMASTVEMHGPF